MTALPRTLVGLALLAGGIGLAPAPHAAAQQSGVSITRDVVYGHKDGMALTYDILGPENANGASVAYMVSGGWFSGWSLPEDVLGQSLVIQEMVGLGLTVFLVRHGSAPRYKVPEAMADVRQAVAHIREHSDEWGLDRDRLGMMGGSAGGHLSLSIGLRAEGPMGAPGDGGSRPSRVAAIVAYFPPVDLRGWSGPNERFPALDFEEELEVRASPVLFATPDDPPTLLLHGTEDELVPISHSERMFEALQAAGVPSDYVVFEGQGHGFRGDAAARAARLTAEWFDRWLVRR